MNKEKAVTVFRKLVRPIQKICIGKKLGLQVIETLRRIRSFQAGEALFPGVSKAKLQITDGIAATSDNDNNNEYFDQQGILPIGIGGDRVRFGMNPLQKVSAALGIQEDPALQRITEEIEELDTKGTSGTTIADAIDILLRAGNKGDAVNKGMQLLHALNHRLRQRPGKKETRPETLQKLFDTRKKKYTDERARKSLGTKVKDSTRRRKRSILELAFVFESLAFAESDAGDVRKVGECILDILYEDELLFWQGVELCAKLKKFKVCSKPKGQKEQWIPAVFVDRCENRRIAAASRHPEAGGCAITIVRNTDRNVGIYLKKGLGLRPWTLWREIQSMELLRQGWKPKDIPWLELGETRTHEKVRKFWRLIPEQGMIMNGIDQNDIPPTELNQDIIETAVRQAFHPECIDRWRESRHIPKNKDINNVGAASDATAKKKWRKTKPEEGPIIDIETVERSAQEDKPAADAQAPASTPTPDEAQKAEAGTNNIEEALKKAASRKSRSRSKKSQPEASSAEGENAQAAAQ